MTIQLLDKEEANGVENCQLRLRKICIVIDCGFLKCNDFRSKKHKLTIKLLFKITVRSECWSEMEGLE